MDFKLLELIAELSTLGTETTFEEMCAQIWAKMVASCITLVTVVQSVAFWMTVGINASMSDFCCYVLEYAMESIVDGEYPPIPDSTDTDLL